MKLVSALRLLVVLSGLLALSAPAHADCSNPAGIAGSIIYSANYNQPAWCDGTEWNSFGGGSAAGGADNLGNHTATQDLDMSGNSINSGLNATFTGLGNFGLLLTGGLTVTGQTSTTTISTTVIQVGDDGAVCTSGLAGGVRYNSTSNTIDYCSGSAWLSLGPSATVPVAFQVSKNADQTVSSGVHTKLTWQTEEFDTNNNFASNRFTATIPGYYLINLNTFCTTNTTNGSCQAEIYKNGSAVKYSAGRGDSTGVGATANAILYLAVGDYVEGYVFDDGTTIQSSGGQKTYMSGVLLTAQGGGGGGGTANPAGSTNDVQFNSGGLLAADTGNFTYTGATGTLSATTISTTRVNVASVTSVISLNGGSGNMISSGSAIVSTSSAGSITITTDGVSAITVGGNGFVGIGTAAPQAVLDVSGSWMRIRGGPNQYSGLGIENDYAGSGVSFVDARMSNGIPDSSIFFGHSTDAGSYISLMTQPAGAATDRRAERVRIDGDGNLGVGTSNPEAAPDPGVVLSKSGYALIGNSAQASGWGFVTFYRSGSVMGGIVQNGTSAVSYNTTSDRRLKENIIDAHEGLRQLMQLPVREFAFRNDPSHTIVTGFIAQELNKVFPEAVTTNGDDGEISLTGKTKPWSVDYGRVTPLIVKSIQDLDRKTDERLKYLQSKNDHLKAELVAEHQERVSETNALKAANDNFAKEIQILQHEMRKVR